MNKKPHTWIIDSRYTGELRAREGLARRLPFQQRIVPKPNGHFSQYIQELNQLCQQDKPPMIILVGGTGEETTAEIVDLSKALPTSVITVFLASILPEQPDAKLWEYDLIATPQLRGENVVTLTCVPHTLTDERLKLAFEQHPTRYQNQAKPLTAVLIGGNTRYCFGFDSQHAGQLADKIRAFWQSHGGSIVLSNSRRTPEPAWHSLLTALRDLPVTALDWQQADEHAYLALIANADFFIVTGDSLSMCSEAVYTGKPTWVDLTNSATECYHREIIGGLLAQGTIRLLTPPYTPYHYNRPDPTGQVSDAILKLIKQRGLI